MPGKIINHPNGTDVYHGVPKDYVCGSVRPDIFLQVGDRLGGDQDDQKGHQDDHGCVHEDVGDVGTTLDFVKEDLMLQ